MASIRIFMLLIISASVLFVEESEAGLTEAALGARELYRVIRNLISPPGCSSGGVAPAGGNEFDDEEYPDTTEAIQPNINSIPDSGSETVAAPEAEPEKAQSTADEEITTKALGE